MAKLEELESEWAKDSKIDRVNLDGESLRIPELHHKYYKMFIRERVQLKKEEGEYAEFYKTKVEYYQGRLDHQTLQEHSWDQCQLEIMKKDLPLYLDGDPEIRDKKLKMHLQKEKVDYLQSIINVINNRGFQIKNAIDFIKFSNGGN